MPARLVPVGGGLLGHAALSLVEVCGNFFAGAVVPSSPVPGRSLVVRAAL